VQRFEMKDVELPEAMQQVMTSLNDYLRRQAAREAAASDPSGSSKEK